MVTDSSAPPESIAIHSASDLKDLLASIDDWIASGRLEFVDGNCELEDLGEQVWPVDPIEFRFEDQQEPKIYTLICSRSQGFEGAWQAHTFDVDAPPTGSLLSKPLLYLLEIVLIFFAIAIFLGVELEKGQHGRLLILTLVESWIIAVALAVWDVQRFRLALRFAGGLTFFFFLAYLVDMMSGGALITNRPGGQSIVNALLGMVVFGLPGLKLMLTGHLGFSKH